MKDKKFAYGDAKAGGGFSDRLLIGTIKGIDYGPVSTNECISVIDLAFKNTKIKITRHQNIKEYLMIEYAMNAGSWPIIFLERSVRKALTNPRLLYRAFRSTRECLEVVRARGVDFKEFPETNIYFATPKIKIWSMVLLMAFMFRTSEYYKRNTVHSINGREESIVFYNDLIKASSLYNIKTPMMQTYMEVMVEQNMI
jgi:hypothetical protein